MFQILVASFVVWINLLGEVAQPPLERLDVNPPPIAESQTAPATESFSLSNPVDYHPIRITGLFPEKRQWEGTEIDHNGIDIACPRSGCPSGLPRVLAAEAGTVSHVGFQVRGFGNWIEIVHLDGTKTRYAHLAEKPMVRQGAAVSRGQQIGIMGSTGYATGVHLHFEMHRNGGPVDPQPELCAAVECTFVR